MAGKNIGHKEGTITAVTATGYITLASVAGYYKNAIVWMNDSTATVANNKRAVITEVLTGTNQLGIGLRSNDPGEPPKYGRSDMTAYNGGSITQLEQLIYNNDDKPLD